MAKIKLTDRYIQTCTCPPGKRLEIADTLCPGLYLRVSSGGSKSFTLLVRRGTLVRRTLGRYPVLSLSDARKAALATLREMAEHGVADRPHKHAQTMLEMIESYSTLHLQPNLRSWRYINAKLLCLELKPLQNRQADTVSRAELVAVMDQLVAAGKPHAAENLLKALRAMFNWAVARGELANNPLLGLKSPAKHVQRDRTLTDGEIARVWSACASVPEPFGTMVQLLLLTGARRSEIANMTWDELADGTWHLPASRAKNGRTNSRPLPASARDILSLLTDTGPGTYVLSTTAGLRPSSDFSKRKRLLDEASGTSGWTLHDLRRTARSKLSQLGVPWEVARRIVGHSVDSLDATYDRHAFLEEKRAALELLSAHIENLSDAAKTESGLANTSSRNDVALENNLATEPPLPIFR